MLRKLGRIRPSPPNDDGDVPRGQVVTEKFPVLTFGGTPEIDMETWRLRIFGLVEQELTLDWGQLQDLDQTSVDAEFHCVTQWSRMENTWEGVSFARVAGLARPLTEAKFAMVHCYGGYSTNLPLGRTAGRRRTPCEPARWRTARSRARWPAAPGGPEALRVEERQVGERDRAHGRRRPGLLGVQGLPHGGGSVEGAAILG